MLSESVKELAATKPLRAVEFDPPRGMKLLYKDGTETEVLLGMDQETVRSRVKSTYDYNPFSIKGCPSDAFDNVPFVFYYANDLTLKNIVFGDIDHHGSSEEEIRALEVKAYFRGKSLLDTPRRELKRWIREELDLSTYGEIVVSELGFLVNYLKDDKRASDIAMGYPGDENI